MFGATKPVFNEIIEWLGTNYPDVPTMAGRVQATYDYVENLRKWTRGFCI